jgi:CubicO group peptidase (beta-lactamase class C family)
MNRIPDSKAFTFLFTLCACIAIAQEAAIDAIINREMNERHIPGLQIAVVQHGKVMLSKSYSYANLSDSIPVTRESIFAINSCTKAVTGVAIMQLVEEGKVELSKPVSYYIDSLPNEWQAITIKQLLTHISGLPDLLTTYDPATHGLGKLGTDAAAWEKVKTMPMQFRTGEQFRYNQTNYALLGMIIEKLSGKPFTQVFSERQFNIVGMPHTLFGDSRDVIPHYAPTYRFSSARDGRVLDKPLLTNNYSEFSPMSRASSGLNSTAEDIARWIIALQQGKLLGKDALRTLWQPGAYNNGTPTQWALGWGITKQRVKHRAVGMSGGGRSAFLVYPDDDLAVIVLTNLAGGVPEDYLEEIAGCYDAGIATADPITLLRMRLQKEGYTKAIEVVAAEKKKDPLFSPDENELNDWGYRLMSNGKLNNALAIFQLNTTLYPKSWNVYDSYGEALLKNGQKEEAKKMYTRSVELNPDNAGGKRVLERMK